MHAVLASEPDDPAFAPEEASPESLALLTATIDERDRRGLPAPARRRRDSRRSSAAATRCATLLRELSTVGSVGQRDPPPRRPPPRPGALGGRRLDRDRLRGRARAPAARAARASARRCATSPGCCARSRTRVARRRSVDGAEASRSAPAHELPRRLPRRGRSGAGLLPPRDDDRAAAARSSSSRRPSTSCATSWPTGPTGFASPWRGSCACSSERDT